MIEVWLGAGAMALLAVALIVAGARRNARAAVGEQTNLLLSDRRREIEAEARVQGLGGDEVAALEEELALEFDDNATDRPGEPAERAGRPPLLTLLIGAVISGALAIGLYALWGEPNAPVLATATALMSADDSSAEALVRLEGAISTRLERKPDDGDGWFYLAHLRMRSSDHKGAATAFASLHELTGGSEQIDLTWAQASFLAAGGVVDDATQEIVDRVLARRPEHPNMLELLAMDAIRRSSFANAAGYLDRALRQTLASSRRMLLEETLALTRTRLDAGRPLIEVTVDVAGSVPPWLTVFARPVAGSMPLVVVRRPARATQTLTLDDAVSMSATSPLSASGPVEVIARLSRTGTASDSVAEVVSEPVNPTAQPLVHLALTVGQGGGAREAPETRQRPKEIVVDVSIGPRVGADVPVFVIARRPSTPGPPVAVRRLSAGALPMRVILTDADAMMPAGKLSDLEEVEVLARASLDGTPMASSGDVESATVTARLGTDPIALHMDRRLP